MRHYEIVFLVHPDQQDQVQGMTDRFKGEVEKAGGTVHRLEIWPRRPLAYPIAKQNKAVYVLMNIETDQEVIDSLENSFRYNDAILRSLIIRKPGPVTEPSPMMRREERRREDEGAPAHGEGAADESAEDNGAADGE